VSARVAAIGPCFAPRDGIRRLADGLHKPGQTPPVVHPRGGRPVLGGTDRPPAGPAGDDEGGARRVRQALLNAACLSLDAVISRTSHRRE
jgi:hypothetical protein